MKRALMDLWAAARPGIPFNETFGICKFWMEHYKECGSPVGNESSDADGAVYQAFTRGIVKWTPGKGATLL